MKSVMVAAVSSLCMAGALATEIANYTCVKPIVPGKQASELVMQRFNKSTTVYGKCVAQFAGERLDAAKANPDAGEAKRASDAAEAALAEFNAFIAEAAARNEDDDQQSIQQMTNTRPISKPPEPAGMIRH